MEQLPNYICITCRQPLDNRNLISRQLDIILGLQEELQVEEIDTRREYERITNEVNKNMGGREKILNAKLESLSIHREDYHGNLFVGNQCKIIWNKNEVLLDVISDKPVEHERFKVVYATFAEAQPYLQRKGYLKEDNIKTVERLCHKFGEVYPVSFRSEAISPKMHEYIFHVPKFLAKHKSVGLFSEEGESLHASFNAEMRALGAVRDPSLQMRLLQEHHELRSLCNKSLIEPRVCRRCLGQGNKSFLQGVEKICSGCA